MRRVLALLSLLVAFCFPVLAAVPANAAFDPFENVCTGAGEQNSTVCTENNNSSGNPISGQDGILLRAARILAVLTGIASIIVMMIAGIKYITSGGDSNSINSAKNTMVYALVGLVITAVAQGIIVFVVNRLN